MLRLPMYGLLFDNNCNEVLELSIEKEDICPSCSGIKWFNRFKSPVSYISWLLVNRGLADYDPWCRVHRLTIRYKEELDATEYQEYAIISIQQYECDICDKQIFPVFFMISIITSTSTLTSTSTSTYDFPAVAPSISPIRKTRWIQIIATVNFSRPFMRPFTPKTNTQIHGPPGRFARPCILKNRLALVFYDGTR